jgi:hypothetical protein
MIPPQFLPMFVAGVIAPICIRNWHRRRNPYRGPSRVSLPATSTRRSSPGGMDGERIHPRRHSHRNMGMSRTAVTR